MRRASSRSYMAVPTTYFLMHISMGLEDPTLSCASLGCRAVRRRRRRWRGSELPLLLRARSVSSLHCFVWRRKG